jgi:hypothetical protein
MSRTIFLHRQAPPKPAPGQACNGCGVCCADEPCPLGRLVSRRRTGRCRALAWDAQARIYRCGLLTRPAQHLPRPLRVLAPLLARLSARWIAAGRGCDSSAEVRPGPGPDEAAAHARAAGPRGAAHRPRLGPAIDHFCQIKRPG